MLPAMPAIANHQLASETIGIDPERLRPSPFSVSLYGDPCGEVDDLIASVREHGILVPLVVTAPGPHGRFGGRAAFFHRRRVGSSSGICKIL